MIEWLQKEEFWAIFDSDYEPNNRYLNDVAYFSCSLDDLKKITNKMPVENPSNEGDFPGPVLRWYSSVNGNLVLVTYHLIETPFANIEFEDDINSQVLENVFNEFRELGFEPKST